MDEMKKVDPGTIKAITDHIVSAVKAEAAELKGARGLRGILAAVPHVVERVEELGADAKLLGPDRRAIAIAAVCALVPDRWAPDWLVAIVAGWAIDSIAKKLAK